MMLEVSDIHAGYGRIPVLSGINFTVGEHEVVGCSVTTAWVKLPS